jgi:hypothetical protein
MSLDADESKQNAMNIENYRLSIMHERWLSTLILTIHLEIEALLVQLLREGLPRGKKFLDSKSRKPSFAQKLTVCEAANLIDDNLAEGVWAVNSLRNELAHRLDDAPSVDALARFIAAMSTMHPLQVRSKNATSFQSLRGIEEIRSHFLETDPEEVEHFVFISLLLLRAKLVVHVQERQAKSKDAN